MRNDLTLEARQTITMLMSLIRGEIETDASSPLVGSGVSDEWSLAVEKHSSLITLSVPTNQNLSERCEVRSDPNYFALSFSFASPWAVSNSSAGGTFTSGSTPGPS